MSAEEARAGYSVPLRDEIMAEYDVSTPRKIAELFELDMHELGMAANELNGDYASFTLNCHINYTNICVSKCRICAFHRLDGYVMDPEEVVKRALEAAAAGVKELHIVGSHNPEIGVEYFEQIFRKISARCDATIKGLTATEVSYYARKEGMSIREFLSRLKDAGLKMLAGGGAEILVERIRRKICPGKCSGDEWLKVMRATHEIGIKSNATMLFGHIESYRDRAIHLYRLRKLQERTGGFVAFIPLLFHPEGTDFHTMKIAPPTDVLKTIAVSRLVLNNFKGIKAYWVMLGLKLAQVALNYGANDIDGTVKGEMIAHAAGAKTPYGLEKDRLVSIIRGAGKIPVERDAFFNVLRVYDGR